MNRSAASPPPGALPTSSSTVTITACERNRDTYELSLYDSATSTPRLRSGFAICAGRDAKWPATQAKIRGVTIFEARPIHVPERSRPFITTTGTGRPGLSKPQRIARGRRGREAAQSLTPQAPWQKSSQRRRPSRVENRRSATVKLETRAPDNGSHLKNCAFSRKSTTPHAASTSARRASAL